MAFQNITFPAMKLTHGFTQEPQRPVTIVSNFAKEYRINRFSQPKLVFTYPTRNMKYSDWQTLETFVDTVKGSTDSFNFVHPLTGTTFKVRFAQTPTMHVIALDSTNAPVIVQVSDIQLIQVFNE